MKREFVLYLIIAFLCGMVCMDLAFSMKIPDIILPESVDPDLRETIDYMLDILNKGKYVMNVSGVEITSSDELDEGEFLLDNSSVSKYLVVSDGETSYRVEVTAVP